MPGPLLIRADASATTGTGHVMRMVAIAQAWRALGGMVVLAAFELVPHARDRMRAAGAEIAPLGARAGTAADAAETVRLATALGASWIAADGYAFDRAYFATLGQSGVRVLALDDHGHALDAPCDILLRPGAVVPTAGGVGSAARVVLAGPRYALLREEVASAVSRNDSLPPTRATRWLVAFGGTDPGNLSTRLWDALDLVGPGVHTRIVIGGGHPHRAALLDRARRPRSGAASVDVQVDVVDIATEMAGADLAISAAGGTSLELAALGVPSVLIVAADNQRAQADALAHAGAALVPDCRGSDLRTLVDVAADLAEDAGRRREMARRGRELVDGRGAKRVATRLAAAEIALSAASPEDAQMLWAWANEPAARAASFSDTPIPWETHVAWLERRLADSTRTTWIASDRMGHAVGVVRLDPRPDGAMEISINLGREHRGVGVGKAVIRRATDRAAALGVTRLAARIKRTNAPSLAAFVAADYERAPGAGDDEVVELWGVLP